MIGIEWNNILSGLGILLIALLFVGVLRSVKKKLYHYIKLMKGEVL